MLFLNLYKKEFLIFVKDFYLKLLFFVFSLILFTYLLYPIFWIDPYFLFETIKINANHFNNVGTLTLGQIMYSKDLPSTYLIIWFLVKIPLLIIIGILLIPLSEKRFLKIKKDQYILEQF